MNETDSAPPPLPTTAINLVPAGFIIRVLAHVIDSVLWMGILAALVMALFGDELMAYANETLAQAGAGSLSLDRPSPLPVWFNVLFQYVIPVVVLFGLWKWKSATPGKMLLRLRVVDAVTGGRLSTRQCVARMLGYIPPMLPMVFLPAVLSLSGPARTIALGVLLLSLPLMWGFISVITHPRKQGWHDRWAGTMVVVV
jgi:uncharacterized RDD family membrane protein YckC